MCFYYVFNIYFFEGLITRGKIQKYVIFEGMNAIFEEKKVVILGGNHVESHDLDFTFFPNLTQYCIEK